MSTAFGPFDSIYIHGFVRAQVCIPRVKVAAPDYNADRTIDLARQAALDHAAPVLFPELGLSAYSNEDQFHQDALLDATLGAGATHVARLPWQADDVDGVTYVEQGGWAEPGTFLDVRITGAEDYDFRAVARA